MTVRAELANAARRVRAANERLPEHCRPNASVASEWTQLLASVEDLPAWRARRQIAEWTERWEERLAGILLNAPLVKR